MEKFKFKFESVLKLRRSREEDALRSLSLVQKTHQEELRKKEKLFENLKQALSRKEKIKTAPTSPSWLKIEENYIIGLKQKLVQSDHSISRSQRGVEKALRYYLSLKRQTRAIEVLYEKSLAEYKKKVLKEEQKKIDDLVVMRFHLNSLNEEVE